MLEKLLRLVKEEGGKVFFADRDTEQFYCLLSSDAYEQLKRGKVVVEREAVKSETTTSYENLSEEELLDKMQQEIAIWREKQKDKSGAELMPRAMNFEKAVEEKKPETIGINASPKPGLEDEEHFFLEMA